MLYILHYADDVPGLVAAEPEFLANRVFVPELAIRQRPADQTHPRRPLRVPSLKRPACTQRNLHRAEITRSDRRHLGRLKLPRLQRRTACDFEAEINADTGEGQGRGRAGEFNAR